MLTHSSILAWKIPWTGEPDRLQSMGSQESDTTEQLQYYRFSTFPSPFYLSYIAFLIFVQFQKNVKAFSTGEVAFHLRHGFQGWH